MVQYYANNVYRFRQFILFKIKVTCIQIFNLILSSADLTIVKDAASGGEENWLTVLQNEQLSRRDKGVFKLPHMPYLAR